MAEVVDVPHYSVWIAKYMPDVNLATEAYAFTDRKCFMHTLRKYRGLRADNLKAHGMRPESRGSRTIIHESDKCEVLTIDGDSCSLCVKYLNGMIPGPAHFACRQCPLEKAGHGCNHTIPGTSLWMKARSGNPEPMIKQMRKMIKQCDKKGRWIPPEVKQEENRDGKIR